MCNLLYSICDKIMCLSIYTIRISEFPDLKYLYLKPKLGIYSTITDTMVF